MFIKLRERHVKYDFFQTFAQEMIGYGSVIMPILVAISALGSLSCHIMTSSRLCFVGARQGHIPDCLSLVTMKNFTPAPALVFLVRFSTSRFRVSKYFRFRSIQLAIWERFTNQSKSNQIETKFPRLQFNYLQVEVSHLEFYRLIGSHNFLCLKLNLKAVGSNLGRSKSFTA